MEFGALGTAATTKGHAAALARTGFSASDPDSLEEAMSLAYCLWVDGNDESARAVAGLFEPVVFDNNYDIWTWVELGLALASRLDRLSGHDAGRAAFRAKVEGTHDASTEQMGRLRRKILLRSLAGETLRNDKVEQAVARGDTAAEAAHRLTYLARLVRIDELGGSAGMAAGQIEPTIQAQLARLRDIL